jgi:polygalacturonase
MTHRKRLTVFFAFVFVTKTLLASDFNTTNFGAIGDGKTDCTKAIQQAIDAAANERDSRVTFDQGVYLSGAIFIKTGIEFHLPEGVELRAIQDDSLYPDRPTRVAGIEMGWPTALVNVYQQSQVKITGEGVIDGDGSYWWHKFWGEDGEGGMLADYNNRDLRWAVDYDCKRVRALAVYKSSDVEIRDVTIKRSGFWSLTLTYSEHVTVDGVIIRANIGGFGPSSDGIDIDSSRDILVQNCDIDCNDDNICLKAGRDADGLRVNRPTENITIRNCITRSGHGMLTLGSETSGGIRNVLVQNLVADGTSNGIRIKSARVRGGVIENIRIENLIMVAVDFPLHCELNWYPAYSYPTVPEGIELATIPEHWKVLTQHVEPPERGIPEVRNITIINLKATGATQALYANAYSEKPLRKIHLENVSIQAKRAGRLNNATDWSFKNVSIAVVEEPLFSQENCIDVQIPELSRIDPKDLEDVKFDESAKPGASQVLGLGNETEDP